MTIFYKNSGFKLSNLKENHSLQKSGLKDVKNLTLKLSKKKTPLLEMINSKLRISFFYQLFFYYKDPLNIEVCKIL